MVMKGYIYRGRKPVHWSPSSRTALAEAELEVCLIYTIIVCQICRKMLNGSDSIIMPKPELKLCLEYIIIVCQICRKMHSSDSIIISMLLEGGYLLQQFV